MATEEQECEVGEVYRKTVALLDQARNDRNRFIISITEDVPAERMVANCDAIMRAIEDTSQEPDFAGSG